MRADKERKGIKIKPAVFRVIILLITIYFIYLFYNQSMTHIELVEEKEEITTEIKEIEKEIEELETYLNRLEDEEHLELLVREELRLIGSDEVLIDVRPLMAEEGKSEDEDKESDEGKNHEDERSDKREILIDD